MYVKCDKCGYDSGDRADLESLAEKVNADGGEMKLSPVGIAVKCPQKCEPHFIRLD